METDITKKEEGPSEKKSYAGIPEAIFLEDIDAYMAKLENSSSVDKVIRMLDENYSKYKLMEYNLIDKRRRVNEKIPDLEHSLQMIHKLQTQKNSNQDMETQFVLSDQVYAKAVIAPTDKVCLWLGASVMLEYTLDDAAELLRKHIETAKKTLKCIEHDLDFVKDQYTITEVNVARVYNWNLIRRLPAETA